MNSSFREFDVLREGILTSLTSKGVTFKATRAIRDILGLEGGPAVSRGGVRVGSSQGYAAVKSNRCANIQVQLASKIGYGHKNH